MVAGTEEVVVHCCHSVVVVFTGVVVGVVVHCCHSVVVVLVVGLVVVVHCCHSVVVVADGVVVVVVVVPQASQSVLVPRRTTPAKALLAVAKAMRAYLTMMIEVWVDCFDKKVLIHLTAE